MRRALFVSLTACLGLIAVAAVAGSLAESTPAAGKAITPSPIYTAAQLGAPAGDDWLMHMGNLKGWRYSSLTQINKTNVGTLKLAWKVDLGYCSTNNSACGSFEANAVVANGVQYIQDPFGAVYALDGATGARLWTWKPTYDAGFGLGSGSRKPGVAIGEGKVFFGLAGRQLYALDQTTGADVWATEVGPYKNNAKVSSAPIYVNGMVLVGDGSGDSGGNSPSIQAFRAANNGKRIWSWSPIPSPGQPGYKTWTNNGKGGNGSTLYGGGSFWESPIVDPKRKPGSSAPATRSRGTRAAPVSNLYTDSIVALEPLHGSAEVVLPAGAPRPVGLRPAEQRRHVRRQVQGRRQDGRAPAVAYVNKVGMTFVLDRETGKPLIPVKEVRCRRARSPTSTPGRRSRSRGDAERPVQPDRQGRHPVHDADRRHGRRRPVRHGDRA